MQEKFTEMVITSTTNYDQFKVLDGNRAIKQTNVENLMKSFKLTKGMSISHPIIVDKNYNVIDGQHRLAACKKMGIPVHYVVTDDTAETIPIFNAYQEKWGLDDYARYYANNGNDNYKRLLEIADKSGISIHGCIEGLGIITGRHFNTAFKEGRLVFDRDINESVDYISKIMKLCYIIKGKRNISTKITRAIRVLRKIRSFDLDKFIDKVILYQAKLYKCTTSDEYIEMFAWINNYKTKLNRLSPMEILAAKNN